VPKAFPIDESAGLKDTACRVAPCHWRRRQFEEWQKAVVQMGGGDLGRGDLEEVFCRISFFGQPGCDWAVFSAACTKYAHGGNSSVERVLATENQCVVTGQITKHNVPIIL
jgi:hypothetical protein